MNTRLVGVGQQVRVVSDCGNWGDYGNILTVVEDNSIDLNHTVDLAKGVIEQYTVTHRYPEDFEMVKPEYATGGWIISQPIGLIGEHGSETIMPISRLDSVVSSPDASIAPLANKVTSVGGTITSQGQAITELKTKPIKSDGGSSGYYDIPIPDSFIETLMERYDAGNSHIRTEELIRYVFGNDFDFGTAFKSLVRAYGITQGGGKEGNDIRYECNKVKYYAEKIATINE